MYEITEKQDGGRTIKKLVSEQRMIELVKREAAQRRHIVADKKTGLELVELYGFNTLDEMQNMYFMAPLAKQIRKHGLDHVFSWDSEKEEYISEPRNDVASCLVFSEKYLKNQTIRKIKYDV